MENGHTNKAILWCGSAVARPSRDIVLENV